jgi:large subunit ribosomal protein L3
MKFILGTKNGASQIFDEKGNVIPVTIVEAKPNIITQIRKEEKDGYEAVQVGYEKKLKTQNLKLKTENKSLKTEKRDLKFRYLKEFKFQVPRLPSLEAKATGGQASSKFQDYKVGDEIKVDVFEEGDKIKVSGISKGKGFQGVVKRHGFHGAPATHGTKHTHRAGGSIGDTNKARVNRGQKMPGRMGSDRVTVRGLRIVKVDKDNNLLAIKGAVPGHKGTLIEIRTLR